MADESRQDVDSDNLIALLTRDITNEISIVVEKNTEDEWSKSLKNMPIFTVREIEEHRLKSGKSSNSIIKTRDRGRKFMEERYISSDSIHTKSSKDTFIVNGTCKASMKNELRKINVTLNRHSGKVLQGNCTCPAGKSAFCNHIMALLFELANYSLKGMQEVPSEIACTSKSRKWGVPTDKAKYPKPVMSTILKRNVNKRGVGTTLYDPRLDKNSTNFEKRLEKMHETTQSKDIKIGFGHIIDRDLPSTSTKFGEFSVGSPLSYQLAVFEGDFSVISNMILNENKHIYNNITKINLPAETISYNHECFPKNWGKLTYCELMFLETIFPETLMHSQKLEQDTIGQAENEKWKIERFGRITSSNAHKIIVRKRNFENLAASFQNHDKNIPKFAQDAMKHGIKFEKVALQKFSNYMKYQLKRNVYIRDTGLVIQPYFFWLGASPDGLIIDNEQPGLIEIKCPYTKRNLLPKELLEDAAFYVGTKDGVLFLKKDHHFGYYTQIQLAMGLSQLPYCFFVVYVYKGLLVVRVDFDEIYFTKLVQKLNDFYRNYLLKSFI